MLGLLHNMHPKLFILHPSSLIPHPSSLRIWIVTLTAGFSLLGTLVAGMVTRQAVQDWERYSAAFAEIECNPPAGQERREFLTEVQYLAGMPDRLSVLEEGLASRIADAFAHHPLVDNVEKVTLLPTHRVSVRLHFRISRESSVATAQ
jgi:hypothetical protein